jgi:hypothetical protein
VTKPWSVEYRDAYRVWVERQRPSIDDELALVAELETWRRAPPAPRDARAETLLVNGPRGVEIWFRRFAASDDDTVAGYLYVLAIR